MPDIVNAGDSEAVVKQKIIDILEYDGVSTENILSWGVATVRLNLAASRLGFPHIEDREAGFSAREKINALATSPAPIFPNNTELPVISGEARYQENLNVDSGEWESYPVATYSFQWVADAEEIEGANSNSYTLSIDEIGKEIIVEVTATNFSGSETVETLPVGPVVSDPINVIIPVISGEPEYEEALTTTNGSWVAYPLPISYTYKWKSDGVEIVGETSSTYITAVSDIGKEIVSEVTATNDEGLNSEETLPIGPIESSPINTIIPELEGYARTGETLNASNGSWAAYPLPISYTYQWLEDGDPISGETSDNIILTDDEAGKSISIQVIAENEKGSNSEVSLQTFKSEPSWMTQGLDFFVDFIQNRSYERTEGLNTPSNIITDTWSGGPIPDASGNYNIIAPNVLARNELGLLTQPQSTRLSTRPRTPQTNWGTSGVTKTAYPGTFLGIFSDATRVATTSGQLWHRTSMGGIGWTTGVPIGFEFYYSAGTSGNGRVVLRHGPSTNETVLSGPVGNLAVTSTNAGSVTNVKNVDMGGGIYQISGTFTPNADTTGGGEIGFGPQTTIAERDVIFYGGWLESNAFATPIILGNEASQVTRTGNRQIVTVPDGSRAFVIDMDMLEPVASSLENRALITFSGGSSSNRYALLINNSGLPSLAVANNGYLGDSPTASALVSGRNILYGVMAPGYLRIGHLGNADPSARTNLIGAGTLSQLTFGGNGYNISNNTYMRTRKFGEIRNLSDPEEAFIKIKDIAQGWAT